MPNVIIDGKTVQVPAGTLVVEAAKVLDVHIPVFCYHPKLAPVGMCRMCLVEIGTPKIDPTTKQPVVDEQGHPIVNWMPKLQTACTTVVSEGMVVRTNSQAVADARRSVIEFLLTSHPLDCPICDKGGECPLQDHTLRYGPGASRFYIESKFHNEKAVPLSPLIMLDRERCIQCARCVRFQAEIADEPVLGFADRGRGLEITTFDHPPFSSHYSGNTIDLCPVGALTSRDFRFTARVFELTDRPSLCPHCAVGCNVFIGTRDNLIRRITPRENQAVNEIWLCDKGRFVHHYAHAPERLTRPLLRTERGFQAVSWYEALTVIGNHLRPLRLESGGKSIGGLIGDRVSNEDLYLFQKLFRQVIGSNHLDHRIGWSQWNAGYDLVKNFGAGIGTDLGELGRGTTILVLGADPQNEQPVIRLRLSKAAKQGASLIVANGRLTKLTAQASQSIVYRYGSEAFFVLGLVRALIDAGLYKSERVRGIEEYVVAMNQLGLVECADKAGVPAAALTQAAESFARSENGVILFGREFMFAMQKDPAVEAALKALVLLSGHFGRKNNGVIALYPHNNSMGALDMGLWPNVVAEPGLATPDLISKVKALYVIAADPANEYATFRNPGFLIVQDLYLTDTAQKADVVLPAAAWVEREGTFTNTERRVQYFDAALELRGEARPDWQIIQEVAKQLGAKWNYSSAAEIMREISQRVPPYAAMSYDRMRITARRRASVQTVGGDSAEPVQIALGELFGDVSGLQWPTVAEADPTASFDLKFVPPADRPPSGDGGDGSATRLYLAVTRALLDRGRAMQYTPIIQPRVPAAQVEINGHDAEALGIDNGDRVRLTFDTKPPRVLELPAHVNGQVPPGVIALTNNLDGTANLPMGAWVKVAKV